MEHYIRIGRTGAENIGSEWSEGASQSWLVLLVLFLIFSQVNLFFGGETGTILFMIEYKPNQNTKSS